MDRLGEIVRLNDDKLYSQLINYKYRGKAGKRVGQPTKDDPDDEEGPDGLEDKENRTNQDNQSSQSSGDSDQAKNEQTHRHHHRHRKNRIKFKDPNASNRDNADKKAAVSRAERNDRRFLKSDRFANDQRASVNRLDRNSVNSVKSGPASENDRLVIDLEPIDRSENRTNEEWIRENVLSDDLQDYLDLVGNDTAVDNKPQNEVKKETDVNDEANLKSNQTHTEDSDEFDSIEIINLPVDESASSQTNGSLAVEYDLSSNITDNIVEYLDGNSLLLSSAANRLLLNELNQTDWQLSNDEQSLRKISENNETESLLGHPQSDQPDDIHMNLTASRTDSNEGFLYELDLLDGNGALLSELSDFNGLVIPDGQVANRSELADHEFINQQLIADKKLINQHNQLIDNQFVDQSQAKFSRLVSESADGGGGHLSTANLTTMLAATVATLTNKMLLNLSAPNQIFTPNLILNTTGAYANASLMLSPTSKPPTPAPFSYWLTILIAVLIGIASIITIVGNLLVSKSFSKHFLKLFQEFFKLFHSLPN